MNAFKGGAATPAEPTGAPKRIEGRTTRERITNAAIKVLREEGPSAISTIRLAREVGIVQSGFYRHFTSVDACLAEAAAQIVRQFRAPLRESMALLRSEELTLDRPSVEPTRAHYGRLLDMMLPSWPALAIVLKFRRAPGPLGTALSNARDEVVEDVIGYLSDLLHSLDITGDHEPRLRLLAELITEAFLTATETLVHHPELDRDIVAQVLADATQPLVQRSIERILANSPDLG